MSGQTPHHSEQRSTPSTRSCALYRGSITVRGAGPKLVAKIGRQLRKNSAKGCVASSTELAARGLLTPSEARSALLVCCRFIRYQSNLPLVSRGFSLAFGMSRKCPPELKSGIDRVLDKQTSTRDSSSHTWGAWMSNEGQAPHPSERPSTPPTRSYALYRGCVTVRRASPKLVAKRGRQLRKDMNSTTITFLNWGR